MPFELNAKVPSSSIRDCIWMKIDLSDPT